ncbi:MAG: hypothetical protein R3C05_28400 [Pirellulaceae bacterium]
MNENQNVSLAVAPRGRWHRLACCADGPLFGQEEAAGIIDEAALNELSEPNPGDNALAPADDAPAGIDVLSLISKGGIFMIPIGVMSLLVVTLGAERLLALRSGRLMPGRLRRSWRCFPIRSIRSIPKSLIRRVVRIPRRRLG